jgi:hypothetical protein
MAFMSVNGATGLACHLWQDTARQRDDLPSPGAARPKAARLHISHIQAQPGNAAS